MAFSIATNDSRGEGAKACCGWKLTLCVLLSQRIRTGVVMMKVRSTEHHMV